MSAVAGRTPAVTVLIATYNRSHVLRHAIQSVRDSSWTDWELIVVGDACTDDTGACVASFNDSRITFVNLPRRCGDQSGPTNHGITLARGRYIALLNHDDLYRPDHLAACVEELERGGIDLVWVACAVALPRDDSRSGERPCTFVLSGVPVGRTYSPHGFYVGSSWMFTRRLADRVGPWPAPDQAFVPPSQAWLFRAWRRGASLRFLPRVSVILVPSWHRPGSYTRRDSPEHDWLARWLADDPKAVERIVEEAATAEAMQRLSDRYHAPLLSIWRVMVRPVHALLSALGVHPHSFEQALRHGGRGGVIRRHSVRTGAR